MIQGIVNAKRQPIVSLTLRGDTGQEATIEALLDTGYNGSLMLPLAQVEALALRFIRYVADSTQPLLGMSLTLGHRVIVEMVDGGAVSIERL